uniref:HotDog ACOT-type domain-containing protein n=1 Tax=Glossina morsitans morsitans TaxID=37546 RepID=A0A1B0FHN8_GLOMM
MASRNANNSESAPVNPFKADNDEEKKILAEGELRRQKRAEMRKSSAWQEKPTQEEHDIMTDLLEKTTDRTSIELYKRVLPPTSRWMSDAYDVAMILSFPENKNRQNMVFGGFLMRIAYEIPFITSFKQCKNRPNYNQINESTGRYIGYQAEEKKRDHLLKYIPKWEDLPPRSLRESYIMAPIPLRTDKAMQEKYVSEVGTLRLGRLIEAMDLFAIWVCQQYVKILNLPPNEHLPYIFVNIIVNSMSILGQLPIKTSLEVSVLVHLINGKVMSKRTHGNFLKAARNATNAGSAPVNPLKIETEEEKQISEEAEIRKKLRKESQKASVWQKKPTQEERDFIYDFVEKTTDKETLELNKRILTENGRWLSDSFALNNIMSFPENLNAENTAFGGFLMGNAFEVSFIAEFKHCKIRPALEYAFEFSFDKSVAIQSLL